MKSFWLTAVGCTVLFGAQLALAAGEPPIPVGNVALDRYAGDWYEIARYPNQFQSRCASDVTASYVPQPDKRLRVINRCTRTDGTLDEAIGEARVVDTVSNAKLEVRFAPAWLSFLPFVWAPYWIIDLAPDYSTAVVGEPSRAYLWVLSRTPTLSDEQYTAILTRVAAQGYDLSKLIRTPRRVPNPAPAAQ